MRVRVRRQPELPRGRALRHPGRGLDPGAQGLAARQVHVLVLHQQRRVHARLPGDGLRRRRGRRGRARACCARACRRCPGVKLRLAGDDDDSDASRLSVDVFGEPGPRLDRARRGGAPPASRSSRAWTDVERGGERGPKEVEVVVERERAARYGLTAATSASTVALFFRGRPLSRFRGPDGEVQVQARLAEADRSSLAAPAQPADRGAGAGQAGSRPRCRSARWRTSAPSTPRRASSASSGARSRRCAPTSIPRRAARCARA